MILVTTAGKVGAETASWDTTAQAQQVGLA